MPAPRHGRAVLLVALGIDNVGSGLFLPLTLVFVSRVVGLGVGTAGTVVSLGALAGLAAPAFAGSLNDRVGPDRVVVGSQLLQGAALLVLLAAHSAVVTGVAAALTAAGTQTFYSSLFALVAATAETGGPEAATQAPAPKDHVFAVLGMVRAAAFGAGALLGGVVLAAVGTAGLRTVVAADAATFGVSALLLTVGSRLPRTTAAKGSRPTRQLRHDRPFLALVAATACIGLAADFFLVGLPVFAVERLHVAGWVPGACVALLTAVTSTAAATVTRRTGHIRRTTLVAIGAGLIVLWCAMTGVTAALPAAVRAVWLLAGTLLVAAAGLLVSRSNALAEAVAPRAARGRYLATFQYAYTLAALLAPLVVAGFAVWPPLPWLVVSVLAGVGAAAFLRLAAHLPSDRLVAAPREAAVP